MEMLIAVILISLLIGVAMFSFKHLLLTMKRTDFTGINKVLKFNQLRTSIQSIKYYVVDDYDILNDPMKNLHHYFNGTKSTMKYITKSPLFSKDIALVKLSCLDNKLVYQEEPLYERIDFLKPAVLKNSRKVTIYNNLKICEFNYFIKNKKFEMLINQVPTNININIKNNKETLNIYTNIESDYNISRGVIYGAIYPDEYE